MAGLRALLYFSVLLEGDSIMGVNTDGEEMGPGSTVIDEVELTVEACEVVQDTENEKSLIQDADDDVGIQEREPAKATGIPLIPFPKVPSQSSVLNTEHNKAQREHADEGESFLCNTSTTLTSDADREGGKTELFHGTPLFLDTDTFAEDTSIPLEECTSPLHRADIMEILETDTNDISDAMYNTLLAEVSPSDASAFKLELPFNHDIDQMDEEGYTPLYNAALEGHLEGGDDLISRGANPNKPSKGGLRPLHGAAQEGHTHIVDFLIMQGADVNVECDKGQTPLHKAASNGYTCIIDSFIAEGANVNKEDKTGRTAFNAAVQEGHLEAVKYLMTQGAKQNRYNGMTPLYAAAEFGHLDIVKFLIDEGADVNEEGEKGKIPLPDAAIRGHLKVMEHLIHLGSDFNKEDAKSSTPLNAADQNGHIEAVKYLITEGAKQNRYFGMTPLYAAAEFGHLNVVKYFISEGANVNEEDDKQKIALHGAATRGHTDVIEYLIQQGSDVNKKNDLGWTPFNAAVQYGHLEAVKYLMTKGVKQHRYAGMTPLYSAAQFGHLDIVKFFISKGANVNEEDDKGRIPIHGAASGGHLKVMEYLIQQGSDVNKKNDAGWTPFNAAVQNGHLQTVKYLMIQGAKQNRYSGMTPFYAAAKFGHLDIVTFFISNGADVNEENDEGQIPIHGAASGGHMKVMEYLIQQGSDVNKGDAKSSTPLNAAVQNGHIGAVKYLMTEGAKDTRFEGLNPLYIATQYDHIDVVNFLVFNGFDVNERNECGKSPLHAGCYNGNMDIVKALVQHNANVNEQDHDGWTPLHAAAQEGHQDIVDYLTLNGADMNVKDIDGLTPLQVAANEGHLNAIEGISPCTGDPDGEETGDPRSRDHHILIEGGNVTITINDEYMQSRTGKLKSKVDNEEEGNDCTQADNAERGADELSSKNLSTKTHDDDKDAAHPNTNEQLSPRRGDPNAEDTGDPLSEGRLYGAKHLATGSYAKKKVIQIKDADKQSRRGHLSSQTDNAEKGNDCTQADNTKTGADELSLKNLSTRTHEKGGNGEHNPFIHAKLKYPDKGEQDPMLDQIETISSLGTMKRDTTTNVTDCSFPRAPQTWQYIGFDPNNLQTVETGGHHSDEPESKCHSLIDENRKMRESSSSMNAGNNLPINETSVKFESFPIHPSAAVVDQKLSHASTQGTSSHTVWKIGAKRLTSVDRCPSILPLIQTFLQIIVALAIIIAGSPVLVAGMGITERATLQAGKPGVVQFHLPPSSSDTFQVVPYFTLRFESKSRSFCINGETDIEGFKSPSQLPRFTTSVTDLDTSLCVNLMIDNVDTLDEDVYILTAIWHIFENVRYETIKKEVDVQIPPGRAKCFITLSENYDYPYEVHCRANTGSVKTTLSCYQNDQKIDVKSDITNNGLITRGIFWLLDYTYFSCCSHDVSLNVTEAMCKDFEWPPDIHDKTTTSQIVNTVHTSVTNKNSSPANDHSETTPTPQIESHIESGACRQFMLPSLWYFTYLFVYILAFITM